MWAFAAWLVMFAAVNGSHHKPAPRPPPEQAGLRNEVSPPVPDPGASRPPVTPEPASGGGTETPDGVVLSAPARTPSSNAGTVAPARRGEQVKTDDLGFGNEGSH